MELEKMALEGDKQCIETFYVKARKQFTDAGLDPGQIEIKQAAPRMNVGKAIVDEATKRGYDTIVIGRRGIGKSFFMGSVSRHVVDRASNCALWLVS
jgi:nucleotide-binding universal stress UspA family protein